MLWCCASLQRPSSEDDDHQLNEQKHEVVVEKLAIKSIPLLPRQRLSPSPQSSNLTWHIPRHSSKASQSTQTSLSMQHLQLLNISNYETSPLSGFTKVERIQEATSTYTPCQEGIRVMDCTVLFTSISPQEEAQHASLILEQISEDISNPNETLIYKPILDSSSNSICNDSEPNSDKTLQIEKISSGFILEEPKFINEGASDISSLTKITSAKNIGSNGENIISDFFPSSERLIYIEELEYRTTSLEDQNLTTNRKEVCEKVPSEFCIKNKLSHTQSAPEKKQTSHSFLTTHKIQNECSNSSNEANFSEKPTTSSNLDADPEVQKLINPQIPFTPSRRKTPSSVSNTDVLEVFDNPAVVKTKCHSKETKLCVTTLSAPLFETHQTEETFQQSITNVTEPNEDKNLDQYLTNNSEMLKAETENTINSHSVKDITPTESNLDEIYSDKNTKSTEVLKEDTKKENEKPIMPHLVKDIATEGKKIENYSNKNTKSAEELKVNKDNEEMPLNIKNAIPNERNKSEKQTDKNTKSIVSCMFSVKEHSPYFNNSATKKVCLPLEKLEPMPTFIGFNREENILKRKVFTPEHLSLFLATCIKSDWLTQSSTFHQSTSCKTAKLSTFSEKIRPLQTKQIASKQLTLENESKVLSQAQQNTSNYSTSHNYKKKFENHLQYCSNIGTYIGSSKVNRKYKETTSKTFAMKNTFGSCCQKEITMIADEVNGKTHLKENKCPQTAICIPSRHKIHTYNTNEDEKYTKSTSISSSEMLCHNCAVKSLQKPEDRSKCTQKPNLSKEALQSWSKQQKYATSRKDSENILDQHTLLTCNSEPSTSAHNFSFKDGKTNTKNFKGSTKENAKIPPIENSPMYFGNSDRYKENILEAENNYEFPTQKCLYNNSTVAICKQTQNAADACPYSSLTLMHNKIPTKCDKILMKDNHFLSCTSPIQTENLEEIKFVKKITGYKETKKFTCSHNEIQQNDHNMLSSCTPKSDTHIIDGLPSSASSSYDGHSYHGRSYVPSSDPSQSSLLTIEETDEPSMCWTIIIKHVKPDELLE